MDTEKIESQLEKIPEIIKKLFFSSDVAEKIAKIGEENGLMLDQINDLIEETGLMIIGLRPANTFVEFIAKKLKIDSVVSRKICTDINDNVLKEVREEIRKINNQENEVTDQVDGKYTEIKDGVQTAQTISSIEKAGDFSIIQNPESSSPQYKEENINNEHTLKGIEDDHIPMVDHLLTTPINNQNRIETKVVPEIKKVEEKKAYTVDPYREEA